MFKTKGDRLESLIQYVYQVLSDFSDKEIEVKNKQDIVGKTGVRHNIDVYYEFELNGITHKVIFECKNWDNKVTKEKVLALQAILEDIPNSVGVMVSAKGFQSGAKQLAEHYGIELISGSEQSLFSVAIEKKLQVVLPDESVAGEPFYCLMEMGNGKRVTGAYIRNEIAGNSFLILYFSKLEAEEFARMSNVNSIVRGIDKRHLTILCDYSDKFGLNLAVKKFLENEIISIESKLIRNYFL